MKTLLSEREDYSGWLGWITPQGEVRGQFHKDALMIDHEGASQDPEVAKRMQYATSWRRAFAWRYDPKLKHVLWNEDMDDDDRFAVENFLARHGLEVVRHERYGAWLLRET